MDDEDDSELKIRQGGYVFEDELMGDEDEEDENDEEQSNLLNENSFPVVSTKLWIILLITVLLAMLCFAAQSMFDVSDMVIDFVPTDEREWNPLEGPHGPPDPLLSVIAERRIVSENSHVVCFRHLYDVFGLVINNGFYKTLPKESWKVLRFVDKLNKSSERHFPVKNGTMGIVTSCNLEPMCLTNLIYMIEKIHVDVPIGLSLI